LPPYSGGVTVIDPTVPANFAEYRVRFPFNVSV
jgi:hypothetical protein